MALVFSQFLNNNEVTDDDVDPEQEYYIRGHIKNKGFHTIHKMCLFPDKLKEYLLSHTVKNTVKNPVINTVKITDVINTKTSRGITPLMLACLNNVTESVKLLLQYGADVNVQDQYGSTALIFNILYGSIESTKLILQSKNLNINYHNEEEYTALQIAFRHSKIEHIILLLQDDRLSIKNLWLRYIDFKQIVKYILPHIFRKNNDDKWSIIDNLCFQDKITIIMNIRDKNKELRKLS